MPQDDYKYRTRVSNGLVRLTSMGILEVTFKGGSRRPNRYVLKKPVLQNMDTDNSDILNKI